MTAEQLTRLEAEVMRMFLDGPGDLLSALRVQLDHLKVTGRRMTGVGVFTDFSVPEALAVPGVSGYIGDVEGKIVGLMHGAGFVLFVRNGCISQLEAFSYDEPWPPTPGAFALSYTKPERILTGLRHNTE